MDEKFKATVISLYGARNVFGPYSDKSGRKRCVITWDSGKHSSRQFGKLLLEAKLGRLLTEDEQVDHIDEDPTNDDIDNLQVLSIAEHREKSGQENAERQSRQVKLICPECGQSFPCKRYRLKITKVIACSRSCASKMQIRNQGGRIRGG